MHKTWLVARHEFSVTVGRLSYRIFAAAVPALMMLGFVAVAVFTIAHSDDPPDGDAPADPTASAVAVGYVDRTVGEDGGPLFTGFRRQGDATFTPYPDREAAVRAGREGRVDRLFLFPADYLRTGTVVEVKGAGLSRTRTDPRTPPLHRGEPVRGTDRPGADRAHREPVPTRNAGAGCDGGSHRR